jgi:hemolysin-activating ACP:hemolysin acyltransferase
MEKIMTLETNGATLPDAPTLGMHASNALRAEPKPTEAARMRPSEARAARMAHSFAQVVAVFMRDPDYKNTRLADLEWLALPAIMAGQFKLAQARTEQGSDAQSPNGLVVPVAVALWARVSPTIDTALSNNLDEKLWLRANEWASGDNIWLMAVAGDPRAVPTFLKLLKETEFGDAPVKVRTRAADGTVAVRVLGEQG